MHGGFACATTVSFTKSMLATSTTLFPYTTLFRAERIFFIRHALRAGFTIEEIFNLTKIDRWFLVQIKEIVDFEEELAEDSESDAATFFTVQEVEQILQPLRLKATGEYDRIRSYL